MDLYRTLIIAQNLPYPAYAGYDLRNWQNINGLRNISEVGVFGLHSDDPRNSQSPPVNLAFWRGSSDPALTYPPPEQKLKARAWLLEPEGHPSDLYYSEAAAAEIEDIITSFRPHVVIIEGLWLHRYILLVKRRGCRVVLDLHSVETAKFRQMGGAVSGSDLQAKVLREILPARVKVIERNASHASDQIWVCSDADAGLMEEIHTPPAPVHVVPNAVNVDGYEKVRADNCARHEEKTLNKHTLISPAVFSWEPNAEAAKFLIEEVFPSLAAIFPDCRLLLPGGQPTPQMIRASERDSRIVVTGVVPDMRHYFAAASVMAAPLFQGGGTRLKILESFASNLPVLSTAKGAEGLDVEDGIHLLVAESAEEFVKAVQRIWTDEALAQHLAANAFELVKRCYSWDTAKRRISAAINELNGSGSCYGA